MSAPEQDTSYKLQLRDTEIVGKMSQGEFVKFITDEITIACREALERIAGMYRFEAREGDTFREISLEEIMQNITPQGEKTR